MQPTEKIPARGSFAALAGTAENEGVSMNNWPVAEPSGSLTRS